MTQFSRYATSANDTIARIDPARCRSRKDTQSLRMKPYARVRATDVQTVHPPRRSAAMHRPPQGRRALHACIGSNGTRTDNHPNHRNHPRRMKHNTMGCPPETSSHPDVQCLYDWCLYDWCLYSLRLCLWQRLCHLWHNMPGTPTEPSRRQSMRPMESTGPCGSSSSHSRAPAKGPSPTRPAKPARRQVAD